MNWLESGSFSSILSQAQKSIDRVLDIPTDDGRQESQTSSLHLQSPKKLEKKSSEKKSSGSWLAGADSFWGSFTQNTSSSLKSDKNKPNEVGFKEANTTEMAKEQEKSDVSTKETKLPVKAMNLKRNGKKRISKKKVEALENQSSDTLKQTQRLENQEGAKNDNLSEMKLCPVEAVEKQGQVDINNVELQIDKNVSSNKGILATSSDDILKDMSGNSDNRNNVDGLNTGNDIVREKSKELFQRSEMAEKDETNDVKENAMNEQDEKMENNDKMEENGFGKDDIESKRETMNAYESSSNSGEKFDYDKNSKIEVDKVAVDEKKEQGQKVQQEEVIVQETFENLDLSSSPHITAPTPHVTQKKELLHYDTNEDDQLMNLNKLPKSRETAETIENNGGQVTDDNVLDEHGVKEQTDASNSKLLEIIEARESKLVELSRENLNLQETNAILRSQIEQQEALHKTDDAEFEEMKNEFTKRIGESDAKFQAAAKERDQFKKLLEETQKCLSSDMEQQLKEFQLLLQQKDEQIAQLMEEGEKLSKQILQRNTNIKKLRAKEKESSAASDSQRLRLEAAETEIERLTGILRERDHHEKEQDDAINKLNAYIKKQDDLIAKQKTELEESSAKLPSLQTALDNAYKEITELNKVNAAKSNEVQEATLSVEMTAKEELRIALEKLKKEAQRESDVLAMEVTDLQTQLSRSEQQAARREDNLRQEIEDVQIRLQEAETRNQELTQSVSVATRPLLRQIENLQHSYGSQQASWEKLEKNLTERFAEVQSQLATAQEKERATTERSLGLASKVASLESQVANYRQEKSRIEAELELEKAKSETLEDYKSKESGKIEALKVMHSKQLETIMIEKSLLEQQLVVERTKHESEQKKFKKLEEQMNSKERTPEAENVGNGDNEGTGQHTALEKRQSRNSSSSSVFSLSDTMTKSLPSGGTAVLEELRATIRHKEGELESMQSAVSTLEASRESLTQELTILMTRNENLDEENKQLRNVGKSFQELQTKYNALLQMYGEKQEETEELKLDLQDIKKMYRVQIQELLSER